MDQNTLIILFFVLALFLGFVMIIVMLVFVIVNQRKQINAYRELQQKVGKRGKQTATTAVKARSPYPNTQPKEKVVNTSVEADAQFYSPKKESRIPGIPAQAGIKTDERIKQFMNEKTKKPILPENKGMAVEIHVPRTATRNNRNQKDKAILFRIDEEHKYTDAAPKDTSWWVPESVEMLLPNYEDRTDYIDLRTFRGTCQVYVNEKFSHTAEIKDMASAQSLWKAIQGYCDVCIRIV